MLQMTGPTEIIGARGQIDPDIHIETVQRRLNVEVMAIKAVGLGAHLPMIISIGSHPDTTEPSTGPRILITPPITIVLDVATAATSSTAQRTTTIPSARARASTASIAHGLVQIVPQEDIPEDHPRRSERTKDGDTQQRSRRQKPETDDRRRRTHRSKGDGSIVEHWTCKVYTVKVPRRRRETLCDLLFGSSRGV
jgi:hypothetical protein